MKNLTFLFLVLPIWIFGQGSIKMTAEYGSNNREIQDILSFEGIDAYNVKFIGNELKGKHFCLIAKQMWDGKLTETDTIFNTAKMPMVTSIESDTLLFKVIAKKFTEDKLKVFFRFDQFGSERFFAATESLDYSLRDLGNQMQIEAGKPFPAFAYILPYEKDGWQMYCAVESSGKDVESWGREFGIKHYLIFEMLFE